MITAQWTKAEAKASDKILAQLTETHYTAGQLTEQTHDRALVAAGARNTRLGRHTSLSFDGRTHATINDVRNGVRGDKFGDRRYPNCTDDTLTTALAAYDKARIAESVAAQDIDDHETANYKGWQRFFLVPDGHIHASTRCSSLRPTTRIGWLPQLSGETEAEAVAAHGAMLCTKCFPTAPVEWTRGKPADPNQCPGGYPKDANLRLYSPRGTCPECDQNVSVTSTGKTRKHTKGA